MALQKAPIKPTAGVGLAPRGDVFMSGNVCNRVALCQCRQQREQRGVLQGFKAIAFQPFQFNAN